MKEGCFLAPKTCWQFSGEAIISTWTLLLFGLVSFFWCMFFFTVASWFYFLPSNSAYSCHWPSTYPISDKCFNIFQSHFDMMDCHKHVAISGQISVINPRACCLQINQYESVGKTRLLDWKSFMFLPLAVVFSCLLFLVYYFCVTWSLYWLYFEFVLYIFMPLYV